MEIDEIPIYAEALTYLIFDIAPRCQYEEYSAAELAEISAESSVTRSQANKLIDSKILEKLFEQKSIRDFLASTYPRTARTIKFFRRTRKCIYKIIFTGDGIKERNKDLTSHSLDFFIQEITQSLSAIEPFCERAVRLIVPPTKAPGRPLDTPEEMREKLTLASHKRSRDKSNIEYLKTENKRLKRELAISEAALNPETALKSLSVANGAWRDSGKVGRLTIPAGVRLAQLQVAGCSQNKLSTIVELVVELLWGPQSDDTMAYFTAAKDTVFKALSRNASLEKLLFREEMSSDSITAYALLVDESVKKKKKLTITMMAIYKRILDLVDGIPDNLPVKTQVLLRALRCNINQSSKAKQQATYGFETALEELGVDVIYKCRGGTSDWKGKGAGTIALLKLYDKHTAAKELENPGKMKINSFNIVGLQFDLGGEFRQHLLLYCGPHFVDRILRPVLVAVSGLQGLNLQTTTQGAYSLQFYIGEQLPDKFLQVLCDFYGEKSDIDPIFLKAIGLVNLNRWATLSRISQTIIARLNIPATSQMIAAVYENSMSSNDKKLFETCDGSGEISVFLLALQKLANGCPGGAKSNTRQGVLDAIAFLTSDYHRIALTINAAFHSFTMRLLDWYNSMGKITSIASMNSTKAIELPAFLLNLLEELALMSADWKLWNPELFAEITRISLRSDPTGTKNMFKHYDKLLKKKLRGRLKFAMSYITSVNFNAGWCFSWVIIPGVGAAIAKGIVKALTHHGHIPEETTEADDRTDAQELRPLPLVLSWKIGDRNFPLPGMISKEVTDMVASKFTTKKMTLDLANLFGWLFPPMLLELRSLAAGSLTDALRGHIHGQALDKDWSQVEAINPNICESLKENYSCYAVAMTAVECGFEDLRQRSHSNASEKTRIDEYSAVLSVIRPIHREEKLAGNIKRHKFKVGMDKEKFYRAGVDKRSRRVIMRALSSRAEKLSVIYKTNPDAYPSKRIKGQGNIAVDFALSTRRRQEEQRKNETAAKKGGYAVSADTIAARKMVLDSVKCEYIADLARDPTPLEKARSFDILKTTALLRAGVVAGHILKADLKDAKKTKKVLCPMLVALWGVLGVDGDEEGGEEDDEEDQDGDDDENCA